MDILSLFMICVETNLAKIWPMEKNDIYKVWLEVHQFFTFILEIPQSSNKYSEPGNGPPFPDPAPPKPTKKIEKERSISIVHFPTVEDHSGTVGHPIG